MMIAAAGENLVTVKLGLIWGGVACSDPINARVVHSQLLAVLLAPQTS